jgi:hypothetical protein
VGVEVAIGLKVISFHVNGRGGGVVKGLLEIDGNSTKRTLESFTQNGIEGLLGVWEAGGDEHIAHGDVFDLLYEACRIDCIVDEAREEAHHVGNHLQHRKVIEDLDRKRHIHDGLPRHQI